MDDSSGLPSARARALRDEAEEALLRAAQRRAEAEALHRRAAAALRAAERALNRLLRRPSPRG